jgi:hypothetical protein
MTMQRRISIRKILSFKRSPGETADYQLIIGPYENKGWRSDTSFSMTTEELVRLREEVEGVLAFGKDY